ncbi:MAG: hypothetical protein AB9866_29860 [Syntrophobacteraceae bacterium]
MEGYITFYQLGLLIVFLAVVVTSGLVIVTLRNVNAAVKDIGKILKMNLEPLNQAIPNIATASENVVAITNDLRTGLGETSKAVETADQIATYAMVIGETAKALANLFTATRKH